MADKVTIKSIAQDLGVSHMTVSRALSDHPSVRLETRKRIVDYAKERGYVRSAAASAIRGGPSSIVGLLLPNIINEFYARFANDLTLLCEDRGLQVITHLTNDDPGRERQALLHLREQRAQAVILVPTPAQPYEDSLRYLDEMRVVQFIRTYDALPDAPLIGVDDTPSIASAVKHLIEDGHEKIGFIGGHELLSSGRERKMAFLDALRSHATTPLPELTQTGAPSVAMGRNSARRLLAGPDAPTAIVCAGFEISNGALEAILTDGISMPDQVAFVGYGDPAFYRWISGGISTISLPVDALSKAAIGLLTTDTNSNHPHRMRADFIIRTSA